MKADLDRLMRARNLNAVYVPGAAGQSPLRMYLCNGVDLHYSTVLKPLGQAPILFVGPMEMQEAEKSGLEFHNHNEFGWPELIKQAEGNRDAAQVLLWGRIMAHFQIPAGRVGIYGTGDVHIWLERARQLQERYPQYQLVGETGTTIFDEAFITKDEGEIEQMQSVAVRTSAVLQATWDFIASHRAAGETVVNAAGVPLTIGAVKRFVRRELLDRELEDTDMIFAQGRDGGYPHSRGESAQALQLGQPIVFDLFPREIGGGYFHDCTRTWSIGYARPEVQTLFDTVKQAFNAAVETYAEPGQPMHLLDEAVLDVYERAGHPTLRTTPSTTTGYIHTLGHGLGLNVHERPSLSHLLREDRFRIGNVFTIEPGLYYPEQGMGARIEDTVMIDSSGALVTLTNFHKDLVLPLRG